MEQQITSISNILRERESEAVEILSRAFEHDPAMKYIFPPHEPDFAARLHHLCRFVCRVRYELEFPPLGCFHQGQLVGVACVAEPVKKPWPTSLVEKWEACEAFIGPAATQRLEAYSQLTDRLRPTKSHFYLSLIGVDPQAQGRGYGRTLFDAIQSLSEAHRTSTGVALDTENPINVPLYEHFGYHVVTKTKLDGLDVWYMFRPNGAQYNSPIR
jgi:GNAT superfamily N-acetyltransferase